MLKQLLGQVISFFISAYQKSDLPGKFWFYSKTKGRMGRFLIQHRLKTGRFWVPWDQWCFWLEYGPENYYLDEFIPFTEVINTLEGDVSFFDLGADIGVVSALVAGRCSNIRQVVAVEPNPNSFGILKQNLQALSVPALALNCAVSNYCGRANLHFQNQLGSDHEGFITPQEEGNTQVFTLSQLVRDNALVLSENRVIKIDVEGQEINTIEGAAELITGAKQVVILLELHPEVLQRDGLSAESLFQAAEAIAPFEWFLPAQENRKVDRNKAFFSQFPEKQYDVIGVSMLQH